MKAYVTVVEVVAAELMVDVEEVLAFEDDGVTAYSHAWADVLASASRVVAHTGGGLWAEGETL